MVFSGTAGCPAFNPNPWKADICQVDDDDDKGSGFPIHLKADICQVDDNDDRGVDEQIVRIKCYQGLEVRWPKGKSDGTNDDFEDHCYDADDEKSIGRVAKTRFSHTTMLRQTRLSSLSSSKSLSKSSPKSSLSSSSKSSLSSAKSSASQSSGSSCP